MMLAEQIFIGACHIGVTTIYGAQFAKSFMPRSEAQVQARLTPIGTPRDQMWGRITSGANAIGGLARLGDWVVSQKWIIIPLIQAIVLKALAHIAGVFYYFYRAISSLKNLYEIEIFLRDGLTLSSFDYSVRDSVQVRKYAEWLNLFSNVILGVYSGLELAALITGAVFLSPAILNLLLMAGFTCVIASVIFRFSSGAAAEPFDFFRVSVPPGVLAQRYSYLE